MEVRFYHIDAFANRVFAGNPAGVCFLNSWIEDSLLQSIAAENSVPETAFLVRKGNEYELRWFTPKVEIDLCGHGTLASAFAVFEYINPEARQVAFQTKSGRLTVVRQGDLLMMDFPARQPNPCPPPLHIDEIMGIPPAQTLRARDLLVVYEKEDHVRGLKPDMERVAALDCFGVIATAPGKKSDFVSRFFAPAAGIPEDPVTGSAHCCLTPFWADKLGKSVLLAHQVSARGGTLRVRLAGERVKLAGQAVTVMKIELL